MAETKLLCSWSNQVLVKIKKTKTDKTNRNTLRNSVLSEAISIKKIVASKRLSSN